MCEYYPPGNVIGQFEYVSYPRSIRGGNLRVFFSFYPAQMFKHKANVSKFQLPRIVHIYDCAGERDSSDTSLVIFRWASVDSLFCELVASGMYSQCVEWNTSTSCPWSDVRSAATRGNGGKRFPDSRFLPLRTGSV